MQELWKESTEESHLSEVYYIEEGEPIQSAPQVSAEVTLPFYHDEPRTSSETADRYDEETGSTVNATSKHFTCCSLAVKLLSDTLDNKTLWHCECLSILREMLCLLLKCFQKPPQSQSALVFINHILDSYVHLTTANQSLDSYSNNFGIPEEEHLLLCMVAEWLGEKFHGMIVDIQGQVTQFKAENIDRIADLPSADLIIGELFPACMTSLLSHWIGLSTGSDSPNEAGVGGASARSPESVYYQASTSTIITNENVGKDDVGGDSAQSPAPVCCQASSGIVITNENVGEPDSVSSEQCELHNDRDSVGRTSSPASDHQMASASTSDDCQEILGTKSLNSAASEDKNVNRHETSMLHCDTNLKYHIKPKEGAPSKTLKQRLPPECHLESEHCYANIKLTSVESIETGNTQEDIPAAKRLKTMKKQGSKSSSLTSVNCLPLVQLVLEFLNNALISGVAHVVYSRLLFM